jgi:hypothetical protein
LYGCGAHWALAADFAEIFTTAVDTGEVPLEEAFLV